MHIMSNLEHIRTHIEASAPCSLFSVAAWADTQLNIDAAGFIAIVDFLTAGDVISVSYEDCNFVIDLT
jgi:hypothetical protein